MTKCNANLCGRENYCKMGAYCAKVHPKIREQLLKTSTVSKVDIEIFKAQGSGAKCTES